MKHEWTAEQTDAGARLDVFLAQKLDGMTRSQIAKLLKSGTGTVNGKRASVHRFLKVGDLVKFDDAAVGATLAVASGQAQGLPLHIIAETTDFLILDKPVGLLVHPDAKTKYGTLIDLLIAHDPKIAKIGEDPERPGIMHRLDRDVSGLMVIGKTQDAFDNLKRQFAEHSVDKRYLALVHGEVGPDEGDIRFRIARSTSKNRMAARPEHEEEGKAAWTHYKTLKRFRTASLLELQILSGRTHQIRAHLLALGHPVMGDGLYSSRKSKVESRDVPRLMLQSVHLEFRDPATGEPRSYDLPPVPEFNQVITQLK